MIRQAKLFFAAAALAGSTAGRAQQATFPMVAELKNQLAGETCQYEMIGSTR